MLNCGGRDLSRRRRGDYEGAEMKAPSAFGITLGALAPPLHEQLASQGIRVKPSQAKVVEEIRHIQRDMDAIVRLSVRRLISQRERYRLGRLIAKRTAKAVFG